MYAEERKNSILALLEQTGRVDSIELSERFSTSRETIRRDLSDLDHRGLLVKTHGGAIANEKGDSWYDMSLAMRRHRNTPEKQAICTVAAGFIQATDVLFLDNSSTATTLLSHLSRDVELTILTSSIQLPLESVKYEGNRWTIICIGGAFSPHSMSTGGFLALNNLRLFRPTKAFLSCHTVDGSMNVTDSFSAEVEIKQYAISCAQQKYLLADHTKLDHMGVVTFAKVADFDHVITDDSADPGFSEQMREQGPRLHTAPVIHSGK